MIDASISNTSGLVLKKPFKVIICTVTAVAFFINIFSYELMSLDYGKVWAAAGPAGPTGVGPELASGPALIIDPATFTLPEALGIIRDAWSPSSTPRRSQRSDDSFARGEYELLPPVVIHIQDAHCNYYAQKKIAEIIAYLNKERGISTVNLEGGAEGYDMSPLTDIPAPDDRQRVADDLVREGIANGAEYFEATNPGKLDLWGIENTGLYIENLNTWRNFLQYKPDAEKYVKNISLVLNKLKVKIYSKALLEFDTNYSAYKAGNFDFKDYVSYLVTTAGRQGIGLKAYPNIELLRGTIDEESEINFKRADIERDDLMDRLQKKLPRIELEELVVKTVAFKQDAISQKDFYAYLADKARSLGIKMDEFPSLSRYITYVGAYHATDKFKLMTELESLEDAIKSSLYENDNQRELSQLSKNLAIMKNIFNISLTGDDYRYYKHNEKDFVIARYVSFIKARAPPLKIDVDLDPDVGNLDSYRVMMGRFYELSFARDEAFVKNMKAANNAIIVTGGFHTDNLARLFRERGIPYISIMPSFTTSDGYECPYFKLISGEAKIDVSAYIASDLNKAIAILDPFSPKMVKDAAALALRSPGATKGAVGEVGPVSVTPAVAAVQAPVASAEIGASGRQNFLTKEAREIFFDNQKRVATNKYVAAARDLTRAAEDGAGVELVEDLNNLLMVKTLRPGYHVAAAYSLYIIAHKNPELLNTRKAEVIKNILEIISQTDNWAVYSEMLNALNALGHDTMNITNPLDAYFPNGTAKIREDFARIIRTINAERGDLIKRIKISRSSFSRGQMMFGSDIDGLTIEYKDGASRQEIESAGMELDDKIRDIGAFSYEVDVETGAPRLMSGYITIFEDGRFSYPEDGLPYTNVKGNARLMLFANWNTLAPAEKDLLRRMYGLAIGYRLFGAGETLVIAKSQEKQNLDRLLRMGLARLKKSDFSDKMYLDLPWAPPEGFSMTYETTIPLYVAPVAPTGAGLWSMSSGWVGSAYWKETVLSLGVGAIVSLVLRVFGLDSLSSYIIPAVSGGIFFIGMHAFDKEARKNIFTPQVIGLGIGTSVVSAALVFGNPIIAILGVIGSIALGAAHYAINKRALAKAAAPLASSINPYNKNALMDFLMKQADSQSARKGAELQPGEVRVKLYRTKAAEECPGTTRTIKHQIYPVPLVGDVYDEQWRSLTQDEIERMYDLKRVTNESGEPVELIMKYTDTSGRMVYIDCDITTVRSKITGKAKAYLGHLSPANIAAIAQDDIVEHGTSIEFKGLGTPAFWGKYYDPTQNNYLEAPDHKDKAGIFYKRYQEISSDNIGLAHYGTEVKALDNQTDLLRNGAALNTIIVDVVPLANKDQDYATQAGFSIRVTIGGHERIDFIDNPGDYLQTGYTVEELYSMYKKKLGADFNEAYLRQAVTNCAKNIAALLKTELMQPYNIGKDADRLMRMADLGELRKGTPEEQIEYLASWIKALERMCETLDMSVEAMGAGPSSDALMRDFFMIIFENNTEFTEKVIQAISKDDTVVRGFTRQAGGGRTITDLDIARAVSEIIYNSWYEFKATRAAPTVLSLATAPAPIGIEGPQAPAVAAMTTLDFRTGASQRKRAVIDLNEIVRKAQALLEDEYVTPAEAPKVRFIYNIPSSDGPGALVWSNLESTSPPAAASAAWANQNMINLIRAVLANALYFDHEMLIEVRTFVTEDGQQALSIKNTGPPMDIENIRQSILSNIKEGKDYGISEKDVAAMRPDDVLALIFKPRVTTKKRVSSITLIGKREPQGMGIGLTKVAELMEASKGEIKVATGPNNETTFTFIFEKPTTPIAVMVSLRPPEAASGAGSMTGAEFNTYLKDLAKKLNINYYSAKYTVEEARKYISIGRKTGSSLWYTIGIFSRFFFLRLPISNIGEPDIREDLGTRQYEIGIGVPSKASFVPPLLTAVVLFWLDKLLVVSPLPVLAVGYIAVAIVNFIMAYPLSGYAWRHEMKHAYVIMVLSELRKQGIINITAEKASALMGEDQGFAFFRPEIIGRSFFEDIENNIMENVIRGRVAVEEKNVETPPGMSNVIDPVECAGGVEYVAKGPNEKDTYQGQTRNDALRDSKDRVHAMIKGALTGLIKRNMITEEDASYIMSEIMAHLIPNAVDAVYTKVDKGSMPPLNIQISFSVLLDKSTGNLRLILSDNGVGMNRDFSSDKEDSLLIGGFGQGIARTLDKAWRKDYEISFISKRGDKAFIFTQDQNKNTSIEETEKSDEGTDVSIDIPAAARHSKRPSALRRALGLALLIGMAGTGLMAAPSGYREAAPETEQVSGQIAPAQETRAYEIFAPETEFEFDRRIADFEEALTRYRWKNQEFDERYRAIIEESGVEIVFMNVDRGFPCQFVCAQGPSGTIIFDIEQFDGERPGDEMVVVLGEEMFHAGQAEGILERTRNIPTVFLRSYARLLASDIWTAVRGRVEIEDSAFRYKETIREELGLPQKNAWQDLKDFYASRRLLDIIKPVFTLIPIILISALFYMFFKGFIKLTKLTRSSPAAPASDETNLRGQLDEIAEIGKRIDEVIKSRPAAEAPDEDWTAFASNVTALGQYIFKRQGELESKDATLYAVYRRLANGTIDENIDLVGEAMGTANYLQLAIDRRENPSDKIGQVTLYEEKVEGSAEKRKLNLNSEIEKFMRRARRARDVIALVIAQQRVPVKIATVSGKTFSILDVPSLEVMASAPVPAVKTEPPLYTRQEVGENWLTGRLEELKKMYPDIDSVLGRLPADAEVLLVGPGYGLEIIDIMEAYPKLRVRSMGRENLFDREDAVITVSKEYEISEAEAHTLLKDMSDRFTVCDLNQAVLPEGLGKFDAVIFGRAVVNYVEDKPALITKTHNLLKKGGVGLVQLWDICVNGLEKEAIGRYKSRDREVEMAETIKFLNRPEISRGEMNAGFGSAMSEAGVLHYAFALIHKKLDEPLLIPLKTYDTKAGLYVITDLAAPVTAAKEIRAQIPSAPAVAGAQDKDDRMAAIVDAARSTPGKDSDVTVLIPISSDANLSKVTPLIRETVRELTKRGYGTLENNRQIEFYIMDKSPEKTMKNIKDTVIKLPKDRRAVVLAPSIAGERNIAEWAQKQYCTDKEGKFVIRNIIVLADACTDHKYPDIVFKYISAKLVAACLDERYPEERRKDAAKALAKLLTRVAQGQYDPDTIIDQLVKELRPLLIKPIDYNEDFEAYKDMQIATATAA